MKLPVDLVTILFACISISGLAWKAPPLQHSIVCTRFRVSRPEFGCSPLILRCSGQSLIVLTRPQIQDLAKKNGIKANLKTADIVAALQAKGVSLIEVNAAATIVPSFAIAETKAEKQEPSPSELKDDSAQIASESIERLLQDSLDAFDIEELDDEQLKQELARRGLPVDGDFEVFFPV